MHTPTQLPDCEHCKSRKNSLFHFCHLDEISSLSKHKTCSIYKRGQIIFQEGANPIGLFCVNSGKIKLYKYASDGREQIVRIAKPGDFLGYSSLLGGGHYPISAAALEDCTVCLVPKPLILTLFKDNSRFAENYIKLLCDTVEEGYSKMAELAYKPVRGRLAEALLLLHNAYKDDDENPMGIITVSREDLAALIGTVKETVIRMLKEFKEDEYITTRRTDIIVKNINGLMKVSELYD
ncbi:MAG: Crp/Fnr family transcriptional regulator [Sphingobacteriales bacterium]|nr:MAG: Crp/Fnr family transcriptional regulator [Sphingobacteriales bacterium]